METELLDEISALAEKPTTANLETILELMMEETFAERACLWVDGRAAAYCGPDDLKRKFPFSKSTVEAVLDTGIGIVSFNAPTDKRLPGESIKFFGVRSVLCAPILSESGETLGILYLDNQASRGDKFRAVDLTFVKRVAKRLAPGLIRRQSWYKKGS